MTRCVGMAMVLVVLGVSLGWGAESYPEGARGFAGMIAGKVVSKGEDKIAVQVTAIDKVWKHSRAEKPEALVGKTVNLKISAEIYAKKAGYLSRVRQFFRLLEVGDADSFDVKHSEGDVLTFLELTEAQKERVEKAIQ